MRALLAAILLCAGSAHAQTVYVPGGSGLGTPSALQASGGDLRHDPALDCFYDDADKSGAKESPEACLDSNRLGGIFNVRDYGAVGDGLTDDVVAIQAAIDACDASAFGTGGTVFFPPGDYQHSVQIDAEECNLIGSHVAKGVRLTWTGLSTGTMLRIGTGATSFIKIEDIQFNAVTNPAEVGIYFPTIIDSFARIRGVQVAGTTRAGIELDGWINFSIKDFRCDNFDGFCIDMQPAPGQNGSQGVIQDFSADNGSYTSAQGFLRIDRTVNNPSASGSITLMDARIEWNTALIGGKCIVCIERPNPDGNPRGTEIFLVRIKLDDVADDAGDVIIHRTAPAGAGTEVFSITDSLAFRIDDVVGPPAAWTYLPEMATVNRFTFFSHYDYTEGPTSIRGPFSHQGEDTDEAFKTKDAANSDKFWTLRADGLMQWGSGAAAQDTNLYRSGVSALKTDDSFEATSGVQIGSGTLILNQISATTTWDPANLAGDGDATSTTVTVTGCAVGDPAFGSHPGIGTNDALLSAHVEAANTVRLVLMNKTGGALDVASGTARASCWQY